MAKDVGVEIPARLRQVQRKLERWRSGHHGRSPLPEALRMAAGEAAREHGVSRTGQVLHLEYGKLKRITEAALSASATGGKTILRTSRRPASRTGKSSAQRRAAFVGQAPVAATVYSLQQLRCNACGQIFTAQAPEGVGEEKYDATAAAMIAQMKYGSGVPFYQEHSRAVMESLHAWMKTQLDEHLTEPNSGLGQAIQYMLRHWSALTLFLRQPRAPLDNTIVERALKKAILHRKNALYFKAENGAHVGDLFMSLIHTCELNGVASLGYLIALQKHARKVAEHPAAWMPWNYRDTLAQAEQSSVSL